MQQNLFTIFKKNSTRNIVYIHGAGASDLSFNYIKGHLPKHNAIFANYDTANSVDYNVKKIYKKLENELTGKSFSIVSHSLGGIISAKLNKMLTVDKMVSLSTPYAGSRVLYFASMLYPNIRLFRDAKHTSKVILDIKNTRIENLLAIVSTEGHNPLISFEANDGAVTIESQKSIDAKKVEIPVNHSEVLLCERTIEEINQHIFE